MSTIYLCPYHSNLHNAHLIHPDPEHSVAQAYAAVIRESNVWPYDLGDDPSFFSARYLNQALTWGVCRGDVRNVLEIGDVVVFFAYDDLGQQTTYRLSAIATVERKIAENQIFHDTRLAQFRKYLNLLVAPEPQGSGWKHREPCFIKGGHTDWLWRLADRSFHRSRDFRRRKTSLTPAEKFTGMEYRFGSNYIVFSMDRALTYVAHNPAMVATWNRGGEEDWRTDQFSVGVRQRTLNTASKCGMTVRGLRLPKAYPHCPPARWEMTAGILEAWRMEFIDFVTQYDSRDNKYTLKSVAAKAGRPSC